LIRLTRFMLSINKWLTLLKSLLRRAVEWSANHGCLESRVIFGHRYWLPWMKESFLPENLRIRLFRCVWELGLPTFKEKDAIYTYHFLSFTATLKKHLSAL
jgi:hypothetical protein